MSQCALCLQNKTLKKSHVIPNAIFKRIFKTNNGKAITFNNEKSSPIATSSDSWWELLLCDACEPLLNDCYERYSLGLLRGSQGQFVKHDQGVSFSKVNLEKLSLFFISIFWRAAISSHESYSHVFIPEPWRGQIRTAILYQTTPKRCLVTLKIQRLVDKTKLGFALEELKGLIVSPFFRRLPNGFSFCYLIEGFFVEIFTPGLRNKDRTQKGILNPHKNILMAPYLSIFDVPELVNLMVCGYAKHIE